MTEIDECSPWNISRTTPNSDDYLGLVFMEREVREVREVREFREFREFKEIKGY